MHRSPVQLDLFAAARGVEEVTGASNPSVATSANAEVQQRLLEARHNPLRRAQLHLSRLGLWRFPNVVWNPDGPWKAFRISVLAHHLYILRWGANGIQHFTLSTRPGCDDNPVILHAAKTMAELALGSITPWTGQTDDHEAELDPGNRADVLTETGAFEHLAGSLCERAHLISG